MLRLRNFRPGDADKICSFKEESAKINFPGYKFDKAMFRRHLLRHAESNPGMVKVIERDRELVAYIWFKIVTSTVGSFGRVEHIFVDDMYRKRGLAKKLMEAAEDHIKSRGIGKIKLTVTKKNRAAVSLYEGLGYEARRFVMEKDL